MSQNPSSGAEDWVFRLHFTGVDRICLSNRLRSRLAWPSEIAVFPAPFFMDTVPGRKCYLYLSLCGWGGSPMPNSCQWHFTDNDCHITTTNKTACFIARVNPYLRYVLFTQYVLSESVHAVGPEFTQLWNVSSSDIAKYRRCFDMWQMALRPRCISSIRTILLEP